MNEIKTDSIVLVNRATEIYNRNEKARAYSRNVRRRKAERKENIRFILGITVGVPTMLTLGYFTMKLACYICLLGGTM